MQRHSYPLVGALVLIASTGMLASAHWVKDIWYSGGQQIDLSPQEKYDNLLQLWQAENAKWEQRYVLLFNAGFPSRTAEYLAGLEFPPMKSPIPPPPPPPPPATENPAMDKYYNELSRYHEQVAQWKQQKQRRDYWYNTLIQNGDAPSVAQKVSGEWVPMMPSPIRPVKPPDGPNIQPAPPAPPAAPADSRKQPPDIRNQPPQRPAVDIMSPPPLPTPQQQQQPPPPPAPQILSLNLQTLQDVQTLLQYYDTEAKNYETTAEVKYNTSVPAGAVDVDSRARIAYAWGCKVTTPVTSQANCVPATTISEVNWFKIGFFLGKYTIAENDNQSFYGHLGLEKWTRRPWDANNTWDHYLEYKPLMDQPGGVSNINTVVHANFSLDPYGDLDFSGALDLVKMYITKQHGNNLGEQFTFDMVSLIPGNPGAFVFVGNTGLPGAATSTDFFVTGLPNNGFCVNTDCPATTLQQLQSFYPGYMTTYMKWNMAPTPQPQNTTNQSAPQSQNTTNQLAPMNTKQLLTDKKLLVQADQGLQQAGQAISQLEDEIVNQQLPQPTMAKQGPVDIASSTNAEPVQNQQPTLQQGSLPGNNSAPAAQLAAQNKDSPQPQAKPQPGQVEKRTDAKQQPPIADSKTLPPSAPQDKPTAQGDQQARQAVAAELGSNQKLPALPPQVNVEAKPVPPPIRASQPSPPQQPKKPTPPLNMTELMLGIPEYIKTNTAAQKAVASGAHQPIPASNAKNVVATDSTPRIAYIYGCKSTTTSSQSSPVCIPAPSIEEVNFVQAGVLLGSYQLPGSYPHSPTLQYYGYQGLLTMKIHPNESTWNNNDITWTPLPAGVVNSTNMFIDTSDSVTFPKALDVLNNHVQSNNQLPDGQNFGLEQVALVPASGGNVFVFTGPVHGRNTTFFVTGWWGGPCVNTACDPSWITYFNTAVPQWMRTFANFSVTDGVLAAESTPALWY